MAMTFSTKTIDLAAGPVDMTANLDIAAAIAAAPVPADGIRIFVQNISTRAKVYIAEQPDPPARSARGHCMAPGDGFALHVFPTRPFWAWAASTGQIAISPVN